MPESPKKKIIKQLNLRNKIQPNLVIYITHDKNALENLQIKAG